ncbi:HSP20-like chaperone [Coccomyxa subellipsoidea C-169]|uniref:HSP20-like chaperone n=1 Tax=Coccomyxa subellipsoidea (strain C-169) TaxID=574566 RepID=I0YSD6_COCSC|nr:HSP20-like chaperone [Coccomyxa subellipsoidea C-169]EIE21305.1 HSP20-like chaperone [Coccomyxa subellipsoidea C-169]|eukprot:XP_005645849.1 HSP20-like chaperone [Coccomyxa subellipsoidea C-169]
MFRPRRCNGVPNYASRPAFRPQAGRCNSGWAGGSAFGAGPQVFWGAGANPQSWEQLLRTWGVSADPAKIQEMMRNLERGQSPWDNVNEVVNDVTSAFILPIDVEDADDSYHFIADVPGLEKGDIKIRVNQEERQLTISGERRRAEAADGAAKPRRRSERRFGKFERKFKLPKDADVEAVTARVEKGVLTLMVRKTEAARSNERDVNID